MDISSVKLRFPVALKMCLGPWLEIDSKILTSISLSRSSLIDSPKCYILSSHALHWYDSISSFFPLAIFIIIVVVVYSKMLIRHASIFLKKISCFPYSKAVLMYLVLNCRHTFVKDVILCAACIYDYILSVRSWTLWMHLHNFIQISFLWVIEIVAFKTIFASNTTLLCFIWEPEMQKVSRVYIFDLKSFTHFYKCEHSFGSHAVTIDKSTTVHMT